MDYNEGLKDYLQQEVRIGREFFKRPRLMEEFLLRNGKSMPSAPLPAKYKRGVPKECFSNSTHLAFDKPGHTYCEGVAIRPSLGIPMHHAWVTDKTGTVIDVTWDCPEECYYFGVPFDLNTLRSEILRSEIYGLFYPGEMLNINLLKQVDPEFGKEIDAALASR